MSRYEEACPYTAQNRASRCATCSDANKGIPPCVAAYLGGQAALRPANVISLFRMEVVESRRAA